MQRAGREDLTEILIECAEAVARHRPRLLLNGMPNQHNILAILQLILEDRWKVFVDLCFGQSE